MVRAGIGVAVGEGCGGVGVVPVSEKGEVFLDCRLRYVALFVVFVNGLGELNGFAVESFSVVLVGWGRSLWVWLGHGL